MKVDVLFARFPFGASEHPDCCDWLITTVAAAKADPRIGRVDVMRIDDTPITMSRNRALKHALDNGYDYCVMLDSDMAPDLPLPGAVPFWPTAFDFALNHSGPCVIGAPYCGPPPHENVYVFRWGSRQTDHPNHGSDLHLDQYSREEAYMLHGIHECAALPTGIILIDMRAVKQLPPPWFEYEWDDPPFNTRKGSTEDVYFTRNLSMIGVKQYCTWSSWAGHHKRKCVGKPMPVTTETINERFRAAVLLGTNNQERLVACRGAVDPNKEVCGIVPLRRPARVIQTPVSTDEDE